MQLCFISVQPISSQALSSVFYLFKTWHYKYSILKYTFFIIIIIIYTVQHTCSGFEQKQSYGLPGGVNCSCLSTCVKYLGSAHDTLISLPLVLGSKRWRASRWRGRWRLLLCSSPSFASTRSGTFCKPVERKQAGSKTLFSSENTGWMRIVSLKTSIFQPLMDNKYTFTHQQHCSL